MKEKTWSEIIQSATRKRAELKKKQFPWISADLTPTGSKKALPQEKIAGD
jgi:hypothetical protein